MACGYSQIPGVDFEESFAPVANDITFRLVVMMIVFGYGVISKGLDL